MPPPLTIGTGRALLGAVDPRLRYTNKVKALSPIAYWPLADASGTTATDESGNARNGAYSNVTLGAAGIGDGRTAATFASASSQYVNIYTAGLAGAFNGQEGSISLWAKNDWISGVTLIKIGANGSNDVYLQKNNVSDRIEAFYVAGGTTKATNEPSSQTSTAWRHIAMSWSKTADQMKLYVNGAQVGTTQTGLGTFTGTIASTRANIASADTTPGSLWEGSLQHVAVFSYVLSAATIAALATVP